MSLNLMPPWLLGIAAHRVHVGVCVWQMQVGPAPHALALLHHAQRDCHVAPLHRGHDDRLLLREPCVRQTPHPRSMLRLQAVTDMPHACCPPRSVHSACAADAATPALHSSCTQRTAQIQNCDACMAVLGRIWQPLLPSSLARQSAHLGSAGRLAARPTSPRGRGCSH